MKIKIFPIVLIFLVAAAVIYIIFQDSNPNQNMNSSDSISFSLNSDKIYLSDQSTTYRYELCIITTKDSFIEPNVAASQNVAFSVSAINDKSVVVEFYVLTKTTFSFTFDAKNYYAKTETFTAINKANENKLFVQFCDQNSNIIDIEKKSEKYILYHIYDESSRGIAQNDNYFSSFYLVITMNNVTVPLADLSFSYTPNLQMTDNQIKTADYGEASLNIFLKTNSEIKTSIFFDIKRINIKALHDLPTEIMLDLNGDDKKGLSYTKQPAYSTEIPEFLFNSEIISFSNGIVTAKSVGHTILRIQLANKVFYEVSVLVINSILSPDKVDEDSTYHFAVELVTTASTLSISQTENIMNIKMNAVCSELVFSFAIYNENMDRQNNYVTTSILLGENYLNEEPTFLNTSTFAFALKTTFFESNGNQVILSLNQNDYEIIYYIIITFE